MHSEMQNVSEHEVHTTNSIVLHVMNVLRQSNATGRNLNLLTLVVLAGDISRNNTSFSTKTCDKEV